MQGERASNFRIRFAQALCACIVCGILAAGLWPFCAPANQVQWNKDGAGLSFGRYGSVQSLGAFQGGNLDDDASGSIEVWLEPQRFLGTQTILAFDSTEHPGAPFSLIQSGDTLRIQQHNIDPQNNCWTADSATRGVFRPGTRVFITVLLGEHETSVYIDGSHTRDFPILGASNRNLTGRLVISNSPVGSDSWTGEIFGLAVYPKRLTVSQIDRHYRAWTGGQRSLLSDDVIPTALYLFDEGGGRIAKNQLNTVTNLQLPTRYLVLRPRFLQPAWHRYQFGWPSWGYWKDVLVNIGGFLPVGFLFMDYLFLVRPTKRTAAIVVLAGFVLSLAIECTQWFLPTRDSDMTDVITNTIGTALGVAFYRLPGVSELWNRLSEHIVARCVRTVNSIKSFGNTGQVQR